MQFIKRNSLYIAWIIALLAMGGSLFFSNVLGFAPCVLCWYQRIFMYPLVFIFGVSIFYKDMNVYRYALPLAFVGGAIAVFQNLLYYKIVPEAIAPCTTGVSCTTEYINWFGFVTIPLLSLAAFVAIIVLMFMYKKTYAKNHE